jgi:alpha-1,2-glucosyltransferase
MKVKRFISLKFILPLILSFIVILWAYYVMFGHCLIVDEKAHYAQVKLFSQNQWKIYIKSGEKYPRNAMFPGYHIIQSTAAKIVGQCSPTVIRTISVIESVLIAIFAFLTIRLLSTKRRIGEEKENSSCISVTPLPEYKKGVAGSITAEKALICALQIYFIPLLFPFHFLIYTDSMAVTVLLGALYFSIKKRYFISAIFAFLTIFIRHNYIVFVPFFIIYLYIDNYGYTVSKANIKKQLIESWPFLLPFAAFTTFIIINGRLTLDDPTSHIPTISIGNILETLLALLFLFMPFMIWNIKNCRNWAEKHSKISAGIITIFIIISALFYPRHHWNTFFWLLHNEILAWFLRDFMTRTVFCSLLIFTVISLCSIKLTTKGAYLIYPFTLVMLLPILLIEPRYSIIPLVFFNIFRPKMSYLNESVMLLYMIIVSILIHHLHVTTAYMI